MRDGMRRSVGLAFLLGVLCAPPARAQDPAASRPWSDPPAKPAGTEAGKPAPSGEHAAATSPRAASPSPIKKPVRTASRPRMAERPALARRKAERRDRVAARPGSRPVVMAAPRQALARRSLAVRMPPETPAMRIARPLPPDMSGDRDVDLWVDSRADRIRRAQDGGFLVMRRSTLEDPMGRRMQILRPLDDEDE
ncbi:hypothetical protein [Methylobacterium aquaticum]|uniref:hypothetical protein n=1 Tax=Methylobacterium aquaticum TaxID=270351 RepID=UPI0019327CD8|nr:hypothetical protein [Methylobacterium aquaticum]QRE75475.1 hypothetical protein F1D61_19445 [Methylobacterium aquaticum]